MSRLAKPDINPLLQHLCLALQSYAASKQVEIIFTSRKSSIQFNYNPSKIIHGISQLLCGIIEHLPPSNKITVTANVLNLNGTKHLQVSVCNTGINLSKVKGLTNNLKLPVTLEEAPGKGTHFTFQLAITETSKAVVTDKAVTGNRENLPVFFEQVRKRLQGYFSRSNNLLQNLTLTSPRKAAFLKKVNDCIVQNLHNENFDATALANGMAVSRTQLFRKLKPIIGQSPATYIRNIRLQNAKELLEATDLTVSEVAYKTGFKTPSNFTKVFTEKFGIRPSSVGIKKPIVTNE